MLGNILTKLYLMFLGFFFKKKTTETTDMERDNAEPIKSKYLELLLLLQSDIDNLPDVVTMAGDFDRINYTHVVSKFVNVGSMISNLDSIIRKYSTVCKSPRDADTDIPGFKSISHCPDHCDILANFLMVNGSYLNMKNTLELLKKRTAELILLYTQMGELTDLDEDYILYFERITTPTIREIKSFIDRLKFNGVSNV